MNAPDFALESPKVSRARVRRGGWAWGSVEGARLRVLSLGAGVQSTTLALMAAGGELEPMPDAMIFADPGDERAATMAHLDWLEREITLRANGRMRCLRTARGGRLCPYKSDAEWRELRDHDPEGWADAVAIDRLVRDTPSMRAQEFLHRSCVPLDEVDLSTAEDRGQGMLAVCESGCGL